MNGLQQIINQCKRAGAYSLIDSVESFPQLYTLAHTPQGREFLLSKAAPIERCKAFIDKEEAAKHAIYIDRGLVAPKPNQHHIIAVGDTQLFLSVKDLSCYVVTLLHGAKADIYADGWEVVCIEGDTQSRANVEKSEHAIVFNSLCA